jgi:hypothetical protein
MKRQKPLPPELPEPDLCHQYGKIGISAVAAAVLYQGDIKIPQHTPLKTLADVSEDDDATWSSAA